MFGTLENKGKSQWHSYSKLSVHPYNCTKNDVTGFSSYELMCGCQTRLSVLVHAVCLRGKYKLAEWESDVYVAVKQDRELPIYTIKPENKEASWRTVHQVLLLPCGFITPTGEKPVTTKFKHKPITRLSAKQYDETEPSETEEDTIRLHERLPKETTQFTTIYEVPKSYFDRADSEIVQPSLTEDCLGVDDTVIRENLFHDNPETTVE